MGFAFKDVCYSTEPQAQDAYFSGQAPTIFEDSNGITIYGFKSLSGAWTFQKSHIDLLGVETIQYQTAPQLPAFYECVSPNDHTTNFLNGMELGAAVAATMVLAWCIRAIRPYR